jgi:hypothetical protein
MMVSDSPEIRAGRASGTRTLKIICKELDPMALAATNTPGSTSERADSTMRATKGAAARERGIIVAVGPMLVFTMNRDRGNTRISSMIKGMDLKRFTSREIILYKRGLGLSPPGAVEYK